MRNLIAGLGIVLLLSTSGLLVEADPGVKRQYLCGIAVGFPPYQYSDMSGGPAGIDYEIAKLVFSGAGLEVSFVQSDWDDVMFSLVHRTGKVDMLCGAEISDMRKQLFDFSVPYYSRHTVLFTLENSRIRGISDLYGKIVAGDRHSYIERKLGRNLELIRIKSTASKEESFRLLGNGKVEAVIAPKEVGIYISRNMRMKTKIIEETDPGSPVAFAVAKGDLELLKMINASLRKLMNEGKIERILDRYR